MVVLIDRLGRHTDAAAWAALVPSWGVPTALAIGGLATGIKARFTDTVAARVALTATIVVASSAGTVLVLNRLGVPS